MRQTLLCCVMLIPASAGHAQTEPPNPPGVKERFEQLEAARDHAGMVALWRAHPREAMKIIDSYLEDSLKRWEDAPSTDPREIAAFHQRALHGAKAADEAFGRCIFSDYASAFVGWNDAEKKRFRGGQAAFARSREALEAKDYAKALEAGRECLELAHPLGDWWGMAMGYSSIGDAEAGLGHHEAALAAYSSARMIHHDLALVQAEYRNLLAMAPLLEQLKRYPRALVALDQALELSRTLGDTEGSARLEASRQRVQQAMRPAPAPPPAGTP